jgi:hypothetical protein
MPSAADQCEVIQIPSDLIKVKRGSKLCTQPSLAFTRLVCK